MNRRNLALIGRVITVIAAALAMIAAVSPAQATPQPTMAETNSISIEHSTTSSLGISTASGEPVAIQSGCTLPPCGEIYNHTDTWFNIIRQDCEGCGWIPESVGPGEHKGGYWNDRIDWDAFAVPYRCTVWITAAGFGRVYNNHSTSPQKWISFPSNWTVHLDSYSCSGS